MEGSQLVKSPLKWPSGWDHIHGRKVLFSYVVSYLSMLLISIGLSIPVLFITQQTIQKSIHNEFVRINKTVLQQVCDSLNSTFRNAGNLSFDLSNRENVKTILYLRQPFTPQQRVDIRQVINKEMQSSISWQMIDSYMIYFSYGDFLLTSSGKFGSELAYNTYFSSSGIRYSDWENLVGDFHSGDIVNTADNILYLRTIPYTGREAVANVIVRIRKDQFMKEIKQIDWVGNGLLFIFDSQKNLILSNSNSQTYRNISFDENSNTAKYSGQESVYSRLTDTNGWSYVLVMNSSQIGSKMKDLNYLCGWYILIVLLLGIGLALSLSKRNYHPIREILNVFKNQQIVSASEDTADEFVFIDSAVQKIIHANANMQQQIQMKNEQIRQNYLTRLLRGNTRVSTLTEKQLEENHITFPSENLVLTLFQIKNYSRYYTSVEHQEEDPIDLMYYSLLYLIREIVNEAYHGYVCEIDGQIAAVINFDCDFDQPRFTKFLDRLKVTVEKGLYITIVASVSDIHKSFTALPKAYEEANVSMQTSLWLGNDETVYFSNLAISSEYNYSFEMDQAITNHLLSGNWRETEKILQDMFRGWCEQKIPVNLLRCFINHVAVTLIRAAENVNRNSKDLTAAKIAENLLACRSIGKMQQYLLDTAKQLCDLADSGKESHNDLLLHDILEYINKNINDLNLDNTTISEAMKISPAYLSRFFRQQTGVRISTYIGKLRVEKAKQVMAGNNNCSLKDLCALVGFENTATFIRIFKKFEGITPGKYMKLLRPDT